MMSFQFVMVFLLLCSWINVIECQKKKNPEILKVVDFDSKIKEDSDAYGQNVQSETGSTGPVSRNSADRLISHQEDRSANIKTRDPQKVWQKLKGVRSSEDLLRLFDPQKKIKYKAVHIKNTIKQTTSHDFTEGVGYMFEDSLTSVNQDISRDNLQQPTVFQEFECKPRPKVVQVPIVDDGAYWPSCIELMQCSGCCIHKLYQECAPVAVKNQSTPVWKIPYNGSLPYLYNVYMVHHSKCGCQCRIDASACTATQTFDNATCKCECNKAKEKCTSEKQWSDIDCGCICSQKHVCPLKHYWNEERCRCECPSTKCPDKYMLDPSTCSCLPYSI